MAPLESICQKLQHLMGQTPYNWSATTEFEYFDAWQNRLLFLWAQRSNSRLGGQLIFTKNARKQGDWLSVLIFFHDFLPKSTHQMTPFRVKFSQFFNTLRHPPLLTFDLVVNWFLYAKHKVTRRLTFGSFGSNFFHDLPIKESNFQKISTPEGGVSTSDTPFFRLSTWRSTDFYAKRKATGRLAIFCS